jgi:iron complex outermembrane receptor protein
MASPACAQDNPAGDIAAPGAAAKEVDNADIVVTAQHRPEKLKDVPVAVSSISQGVIQTISVSGDDIRALASRTPSLNVDSGFGRTYPRFYIRGLGNNDYNINAVQPVSLVYDDVALENPILKAFPIFDVQNVEVLRGPQGTLFGRNAPAGVIKITSATPTDYYTGFADVSYGTYSTINATGVISGPIIEDKLEARLSVLHQRRDGWVINDNVNTLHPGKLEGYRDTSVRLQLLAHLTDQIEALVNLHARNLDGTARLYRASAIERGSNDLVPGFRDNHVDINGSQEQRLRTRGLNLTLSYDMGRATLSSITGYEHGKLFSRGDIDGGVKPPSFFVDIETSSTVPSLKQFSQEVRLQTNGSGPFFNQGGFFYFNENLPINNNNYNTDANMAMDLTAIRQKTESFGIFDSASYNFTEKFKVQAGMRYSHDRKDYSFAFNTLPTAGAGQSARSKAKSGRVTWDVSSSYQITPAVTAYARIATGYLAPALQQVAADYTISIARDQSTFSYEAGIKGSLFDRTVRFGLNAYSWTTKNLQLSAIGGDSNSVRLLNAHRAVGRGVEAELGWQPNRNFQLNGNVSYNFTAIRDSNIRVFGCALCTMESPRDPASNTYSIDGDPLPQAPKWIANISGTYYVPIDSSGDRRIYISSDWSYRSSVNFFLYRAVEFAGKPLLLGGAKLGYSDTERKLNAAIFVRNVTNRVIANGAIDFDNNNAWVNDPRIIGFQFNIGF